MKTSSKIELTDDIGTNIRLLRTWEGVTQKQLGDSLGVSNQTIEKWENGRNNIKADMVIAIAQYFNISCDRLLMGGDTENLGVMNITGLTDRTINRLCFLRGKNDKALSDAINMFFADSEDPESPLLTSSEELLFLFREFVLCPERELIVKTMNASNPAFALTRDEALQLRLINHLSEYKRNHKNPETNKKGGTER